MIEINEFSLKYKRNLDFSLKNINLTVIPGEKVLIAGRNGAGKTTLSKAMSGLIPRVEHALTAGSCSLNGKPLAGLSQKETAGSIALLFQDFEAQITATSVKEELIFYPLNLGVPFTRAEKNAEALAEKFKFNGLLSRDISSLSGGEKQKMEFLSMLNSGAKALVLDEPFTDMDPLSRGFMLDFLKARKFEGELVVFDHTLEYYGYFDRIIILDNGEIIKDGGPELAGDFDILKRAGLEAPPLPCLCRGYVENLAGAVETIKDKRYFDTEAYERVIEAQPVKNRSVFEAKSLSYRYPGSQEYAIRGVDLTVNEGDFLAVVGANGSGKTTLTKILAGIYEFKEGQVFYGMWSLMTDPAAGKIGYVYQNPDNQIFAETVFDEIAFALRMNKMPEKDVAIKAGEMMDVFGITSKRGEDPFSLPKGDRQKIACASILAMRPEVIILDEPTTGLDSRSLENLMAVIKEINRAGKTVIIITHYMDTAARYAKKILAMDSGKVIYAGDTRGFFSDPGLVEKANGKRTEVMELSLALNGKLLLNEEEFNACWKER